MGFVDTTCMCKIVFGLLIICFVIDLIGFAIPYWHSTDSVFGLKNFGGLWDDCLYQDGVKNARTLKTTFFQSYFALVKCCKDLLDSVMAVLSCGASFGRRFCVFYVRKEIGVPRSRLSFAGAFCALIAFAVYNGESFSSYKHYHIAFALTVLSFFLGLVTGVIGILDYFVEGGGKQTVIAS